MAPVANGRPHQTLVVPSGDARGRLDGVLSLPIDESRGRSGRKRERSEFSKILKSRVVFSSALRVRGRGTVPVGLAGGLPLVTAGELSHSWSLLGQPGLLVPRILVWELRSWGRHVRWCKGFSSGRVEERVYTCNRHAGRCEVPRRTPCGRKGTWNRERGRLVCETRGAAAVQTER
jgi:hypothetical protein